jgi:hypothetical protein
MVVQLAAPGVWDTVMVPGSGCTPLSVGLHHFGHGQAPVASNDAVITTLMNIEVASPAQKKMFSGSRSRSAGEKEKRKHLAPFL